MRANTVRSLSLRPHLDGAALLVAVDDEIAHRAASACGSIQPSCARKASLNTLERYLAPESQTRLTTRFGSVCARQ